MFYVEYHTILKPEFLINSERKRHWRIGVPPFEFSVNGKHYVIPSEFLTDFASVPRFIWPIISPYELGVGPVPHDFGYYTGVETKEYWDKVFEACMAKDKIPSWKRLAAYQAVNLFGGSTWEKYRNTDFRKVLEVAQEKSRGLIGGAYRGLCTPLEIAWQNGVSELTS